MTSKKRAQKDTEKNTNIARRGPEKKVLKFESYFFFLFGWEEGVRGDLGGSVGGGGRSSAGNKRHETSSAFCENRGF